MERKLKQVGGLNPTLAELMAPGLVRLLERWQVHAPEVQITFSPTKVEMITDVGTWEYALSDPISRMAQDFEYYHIGC